MNHHMDTHACTPNPNVYLWLQIKELVNVFAKVFNYTMSSPACKPKEDEPQYMARCLPIDLEGDTSNVVVVPNATLPLSNATAFKDTKLGTSYDATSVAGTIYMDYVLQEWWVQHGLHGRALHRLCRKGECGTNYIDYVLQEWWVQHGLYGCTLHRLRAAGKVCAA